MKTNELLTLENNQLIELLKEAKKCISRLIDKYNPDDIEAEWIGEIHELLYNLHNTNNY